MKRAFVVVAVVLGLGALAAQIHFVVDGATVGGSYGDFRTLPDGGFGFNACFQAQETDGGPAALHFPCVTCESGTWAGAPAICIAKFKAANGGL